MFHGGCRRGAWYPWALQRLGIEYEHQRPGIRNRVERLFRYLEERKAVFHGKPSATSHAQGMRKLYTTKH
ncbi:MAG: hypothetical protein QXO30_00830 [Candidatus Caldarchaeum sp.]